VDLYSSQLGRGLPLLTAIVVVIVAVIFVVCAIAIWLDARGMRVE